MMQGKLLMDQMDEMLSQRAQAVVEAVDLDVALSKDQLLASLPRDRSKPEWRRQFMLLCLRRAGLRRETVRNAGRI